MSEQNAEDDRGCWITAGWDMNWYGVRPHASEIDALRYAASNPHMCDVYFVPWGEEMKDQHHIARLPVESLLNDGSER